MDSNYVVLIGTVVGAVFGAIGTLYVKISAIKRQVRADGLAEYQAINKELRDRVKSLEDKMETKETQILQIVRENGDLKSEIKVLQAAVRRHETKVDDEAPSTTAICSITTDSTGMILVASPSVVPIFHYLPRELLGKNAEILVPERFKAQHKAGIAKVNSLNPPWPENPIITYGLTKEGVEVPITITLYSSGSSPDKLLISADIKLRASGDGDV